MILNTISLKTHNNFCSPGDKSAFEQLLDVPVRSISRIKGGANSQVYLIEGPQRQRFLGKIYYSHEDDQRPRGRTEFQSLHYLWQKGLRCLPKPVAADDQFGRAVYQYVEGDKIESDGIESADIQCAVDFLKELRGLSRHADTQIFYDASEACFSLKGLEKNLQSRITKLREAVNHDRDCACLAEFLDTDIMLFLQEILPWSAEQFGRIGITFDHKLNPEQKTLSPSDFGFHNALRRRDGSIVFLDFEYFGWDDPAKMICDFILHPAMVLSFPLKQQFVGEIFKAFEECGQLKMRTKVLYPFYGVKWCLIFLNEFIPENFQRRHFASISAMDKARVQKRQFEKSRKMLSEIKNTYANNALFQQE